MANYYVKSGAAGAGDGSTWADAYTTLAAALSARAAGDTFWVSNNHAESQASAITLTSPGTAASPCRVLCVNDSASPPTTLATTASITTTGASAITHNGHTYFYGITFNCGTGSSSASINLGTAAMFVRFEACALKIVNTGVNSRIILGPSGSRVNSRAELHNTTVSFAATAQGIDINYGRFRWTGTSSAVTAASTTLFTSPGGSASGGNVSVEGVDLSAYGSGKNLVAVNMQNLNALFKDCKLGASVSLTTGTCSIATEVTFINCDSGNTNYKYSKTTVNGVISEEATIVRSGGASDGTTTISRKCVSGSGAVLFLPLECDPIAMWNETTGSSVTATVYVLTDNVTLTDADAWVEVEYLGTSGFPLGTYVSDRVADIMATAANQTTDTSTWTTTGLGTPVKQKLHVSFTPQVKGLVRARVMLARASTTMYVDPLLSLA